MIADDRGTVGLQPATLDVCSFMLQLAARYHK
jgi:hypothetical protein